MKPKPSVKSPIATLRVRTQGFDRPFFYATIVLFGVGMLILSSASMAVSYKDFASLFHYVQKQLLVGGLVGIVAFFLFQYIPYRLWKKAALPLMIITFTLLALVFIPNLSYAWGGARRWLTILGFSFQPSELLKLAFIVYLATWLDARRKDVASVSYGMVPFAIMVAIVGVFLMMQPDMGTFGVIILTAGTMYFLGGGKVTQLIALFLMGLVLLFFLVQLAPYRVSRVLVFLNPSLDPQGAAYQINQAFIAIGSGGLSGLGFGRSLQKYNYLPEPMGDSVFAIFAEEMGFIGIVALFALFLFFLWRALVIAKRAPDLFGQMLVSGLASAILWQAFTNMAAISGLFPLTGIVLPFVSYGGTSLAVTLAMAGIILNVSKYR